MWSAINIHKYLTLLAWLKRRGILKCRYIGIIVIRLCLRPNRTIMGNVCRYLSGQEI